MRTFNKSNWDNSKYEGMNRRKKYRVNLVLDSGDSKFGFTSNNRYEIDKECNLILYEESSLRWLSIQQGYYSNPTTEASKWYVEQVKNAISKCYAENNALTFFMYITLGRVINIRNMLKQGKKFSLVLPQKCVCNLVDYWKSVIPPFSSIHLMKDAIIPSELIWDIDIDDDTTLSNGTSIKKTSRIWEYAWKTTNKIQIIK